MKTGALFRISRGTSVYVGGGGAVATVLFFAVMGGALRIALALAFVALSSLLFLVFMVVGTIMTKNRLKALQSRAVTQSSVQVDGNYTHPRTWGVYKVETFKNGVRGHAFHLGNHPVRHSELIRDYGAAELLMLFTSRADAEELKYLLNAGRLTVSDT
jgi:hypothetical protein